MKTTLFFSVSIDGFIANADGIPMFPEGARTCADIGSGGGLPGIVCAILAKHERPELKFTLIDSDRRKAIFLQQIIRDLSLNAVVEPDRIENLHHLKADIITARAVASLPTLLSLASPICKVNGTIILLKGRSYEAELTEAQQSWHMDVTVTPSRTATAGVVLTISGLERKK